MKVLIVDENPADLLIEANLLALKGLTVAHARSAVEGMNSITTEHPDLIVADVMPSKLTDLDSSALLRAMVTIYDLPMITISHTGVTDPEPLGCIGQICKPIDIRTFADDVLRIWDAR
jgi:CheY-like chemotaxis protein